MKEQYPNDRLDQSIRKALADQEEPSQALNMELMHKLRQQEEQTKQEQKDIHISLWYLPMVLNLLFFLLCSLLSKFFIPLSLPANAVCLLCLYLGFAGIPLSIWGFRRKELKTALMFTVRKEKLIHG